MTGLSRGVQFISEGVAVVWVAWPARDEA